MSKTAKAKRSKKVAKREKRVKDENTYFDYSLLAVIVFLICFGLVMLYSTSSYSAQGKWGNDMFYFGKQALISLASVFVMLFVSKIDYHWYSKVAKFSYFASIFLMFLVLTPIGIEAYGARRWIKIPVFGQLQPAEFAKIAIIIFIPVIICRLGKKVKTWKGMGEIFAWGAVNAACVFLITDNLSSAIIVMGITCGMIFVIHPKTAPFLVVGGTGLAGIVIMVRFLGKYIVESDDFRWGRIVAWLDPEGNSAEGAFQTMQGLYAIGSGGFFGKGLGSSTQKMIIPEVQNDMILSIICEELGVFGAIIVLLLFGFMLYRLLFIAQNAPDMYGSLIVTGIFAHIAIQVVLNIAVVTNLIPTTGITLPFISYGGTSIVFLMAEMGIAFGVSRKIRIE